MVLDFDAAARSGWAHPSGPYRHAYFVYRFFDEAGRLLYVGMTWNLPQRKAKHRRTPWFREVRRERVEMHADRMAARSAERRAIKTEHPIHNIAEKEVA